ncbi:MAG TPA: TIGR04255 family protein [Gammaproteobacteria bacterium]|nr:TIGR04255 family protein [Gammaproteobacteria bacterium]
MSRGKLSQAPVIYSLIHVRFSPILAIQSHISAIQDRLRSKYPRYQHGQLQSFRISPDGKSEVVSSDPRWEFATKDNIAGVVLQTGSFLFHTTAYTTFDEFLDNAIETLSVIGEIANISLVERIGVRYIDSVVPNDGELLDEYIDSSMMGFPFNKVKNLNLSYSFTQTHGRTPDGELVAKLVINNEGAHLPIDLNPCNLTINRKIPKDRFTALIDTDHFYVPGTPIDFDIESISKRIDSMHVAISEIFWATITEKAYLRWK